MAIDFQRKFGSAKMETQTTVKRPWEFIQKGIKNLQDLNRYIGMDLDFGLGL